ncbi:MAG: peptidylprolyl isomerase [Pyrinomonadaceae bacterium]|nr:peptidylprolyl isomerase [Pyrinomonadaceae bacterium]
MKKFAIVFIAVFLLSSITAFSQIPVKTLIAISKAEDTLNFNKDLEKLLADKNGKVRARAALAAGRIGDERAITSLAKLSRSNNSEVAATAVFAIGEIESIAGADAILFLINDEKTPANVRSRALESAGKISAANSKEKQSKELSDAVLQALKKKTEVKAPAGNEREFILLGITAALRAKPEGADVVLAEFLKSDDARIRADAGNALSRLRAKNANDIFRKMLVTETDPIAQANAARALGAAEDIESEPHLIKTAVADPDLRVRVSAIRSLGQLKQRTSAEVLIDRGRKLLPELKKNKNAAEKNELLEIASALGRILAGTADEKAELFLNDLRKADDFSSPETEIALARIAPADYVSSLEGIVENAFGESWRSSSAVFQGLREIANAEGNDQAKLKAKIVLLQVISQWLEKDYKSEFSGKAALAIPDLLRAFAAFKSGTTSDVVRSMLASETDLFIRAAAADILADQPYSDENFDAMQTAFKRSLETDKQFNDAQLSILSAIVKLDKTKAKESLTIALAAPDHLVRKQARNLIKQNDLGKEFSEITENLEAVKKYDTKNGTKLGQVLNSEADYKRAVSRRNGTVKAVLTTAKGKFTIELLPEDAPLTVDNLIKLARSGYFNGLAVHRVVPNFVVQDGDPRGDGNGGPGWSIRCEVNMVPYDRGAVGMALSGKDTGGSQWFVTHSPQPHLDGGYTVFGRVPESEMKAVDAIVRGDIISSIEIIETGKQKK